jgi:hypothetical protein
MKLFIGENEYQPCWQSLRGAVIVIKNKDQVPMFISDGLKLATGVEKNFVLEKTVWKRLGAPYSKCIRKQSEAQDTTWIKYQAELDGMYNQKRCLIVCSERKILDENKIMCGRANNSRFDCLYSLKNQVKFYESCASSCPMNCDFSAFDVTKIGYSEYPSYSHGQFLKQDPKFLYRFTFYPATNSTSLTHGRIKENVLKVNVYFSSMDVNYYEETPEIDFNSLLGSLGGGFGLFLGISVLSFFEIIDVIVVCFEAFVLKKFQKKSQC